MFTDFLFFDKTGYRFNRPTKDMFPDRVVEKDGKAYIILNVLGVSKEDITVEPRASEIPYKDLLVIFGKTHNDVLDMDYDVNVQYITKPLKNVQWDAKDGLMTLELTFQEPVKPQVTVTRL